MDSFCCHSSRSSFSEILFLSGLAGLLFSKANSKTQSNFRAFVIIEKVAYMAIRTFFMIDRMYKERPGLSLCGVLAGVSGLTWEGKNSREEEAKTCDFHARGLYRGLYAPGDRFQTTVHLKVNNDPHIPCCN